jgi:hypothetical protein
VVGRGKGGQIDWSVHIVALVFAEGKDGFPVMFGLEGGSRLFGGWLVGFVGYSSDNGQLRRLWSRCLLGSAAGSSRQTSPDFARPRQTSPDQPRRQPAESDGQEEKATAASFSPVSSLRAATRDAADAGTHYAPGQVNEGKGISLSVAAVNSHTLDKFAEYQRRGRIIYQIPPQYSARESPTDVSSASARAFK